MSLNKRKKSRVIVLSDRYDQEIFVDRDDYLAVDQVLLSVSSKRIKTQKTNGRYRVCTLVLYGSSIETLPNSIEQLTHLSTLDLGQSKMQVVPHVIGRLKNLQELNLSCNMIQVLPPVIGRLKNLQKLDLSYTPLSKLPDDIGDLESLIKLNLYRTHIKSLPKSVGRLKKLQDLKLREGIDFLKLPEDIGNLSGLKKLDLRGSKITALPVSIGKLKNLRELHLFKTQQLLRLPDETGDLVNLKVLNLQDSGIKSIPESVKRLKGLLCILVRGISIPELQNNPSEFLLQLTHDHPFLGFLDPCLGTRRMKVQFALACNRARFWTGFGTAAAAEESVGLKVSLKLWPLVLKRAHLAFQTYPCSMTGGFYGPGYWFGPSNAPAIHSLLADDMGRESFLLAILARRHAPSPLA